MTTILYTYDTMIIYKIEKIHFIASKKYVLIKLNEKVINNKYNLGFY